MQGMTFSRGWGCMEEQAELAVGPPVRLFRSLTHRKLTQPKPTAAAATGLFSSKSGTWISPGKDLSGGRVCCQGQRRGVEEDSRSESPLPLVARAQVLTSRSLPARPGNVLSPYWSGHEMWLFISQWIPSTGFSDHCNSSKRGKSMAKSRMSFPCHVSFLLTGSLPWEETLLMSLADVSFLTCNSASCRHDQHMALLSPHKCIIFWYGQRKWWLLHGNIVATALQCSAPLHPLQLSSCGVW